MPNVADCLQTVASLAPEHLAEDWDRVGLHVGRSDWPVGRALLCIDLTEAVMDEAVRSGATLIIAYHPPIFAPLKSLTDRSWKERLMLAAIENRIAIYSPHTALDAAPGGVNDWLAEVVAGPDTAKASIEPIKTAAAKATSMVKIVTFVPPADADALRKAMSDAGAGVIGDYTQCSFSIAGQGTFLGGASTNPAVGKRGTLEAVDELRIEMLCPAKRVATVLAAHHAAHPYEEPAVDVYALSPLPNAADEAAGQGRVVRLPKAITLSTLVRRLKDHLKLKHLKTATPVGGGKSPKLKTVALCAGAGGGLLEDVEECDAFFTGEMRHHDVLDATANGTTVVLAGHTHTERPYLPVYAKRLRRALGSGVKVAVSKADGKSAAVVV